MEGTQVMSGIPARIGTLGVWATLAASALAILSGCVFSTLSSFEGEKVAGGGGVETVGIRGYAAHEDGRPVTGARVLLRSREFLADSSFRALRKRQAVLSAETWTDARGHYAIDSVEPGDYRIEVADPDSDAAVIEAVLTGETGVQEMSKAIVKAPGALVGRLTQGGYYIYNSWVHVYGMERARTTDTQGRFSLRDLPEGNHKVIIRRKHPYGYVQTLTLPSVRIEAGKVYDVGNLELPPGCPDADCDSMVVRYILDRNGRDSITVDSVALRDPVTRRITELDLSRLGITVLPEVHDLIGLKRLELENNNLEAMPPEITRIVGLEYLSLNYNRLRTLPREIGNMKFLIWLNLYSNNIDSLPPAMGNLTSLRFVTVSYNYLHGLPIEITRLPNLTQLFMHHNHLETLPDALLDMPKLNIIEVYNNRLCSLSARWQAHLDSTVQYQWRQYQTCTPP